MMRSVEERLGTPLENAILETYEREGTLERTGAVLGINPNTLYVWMLRFGITRKVVLVHANGNGHHDDGP